MMGRCLIVSAYDRAQWLMEAFQERGMKVTIVDFTEALSERPKADWSGPWGFWGGDAVSPTLTYSFSELTDMVEIPEGFSVWTEKGPLEMRGFLSRYQAESQGLDEKCRDLLAQEGRPLKAGEFNQNDYAKAWLLHLAHDLAAPTAREFPKSLVGYGIPLGNPYYDYRLPEDLVEQTLERAEQLGHEILCARTLTDISLTPQGLSSVSFQADGKNEGRPGQFVFWALTRAETEFLSARVAKALYTNAYEPSLWTWVRFQMTTEPHRLMNNLPRRLVVIKQTLDPWFQDGLIVLNATAAENQWDVWIRVATHRHQDRLHLEDSWNRVVRELQAKVPGVEIKTAVFPALHGVPSPYQVYDPGNKNLEIEVDNVWTVGPDSAAHLDWSGLYRRQLESFEDLLKKLSRQKTGELQL